MGCLFSFFLNRQKSGEYQPLKEEDEDKNSHERSRLQVLEDIDREIANDPTIKQVLEADDVDASSMSSGDIETFIQNMDK